MPWVSHDDRFSQGRKVFGLGDRAYRLHFCGLEHCSCNLTDGGINRAELPVVAAVARIASPSKFVAELVASGLWIETEEGWVINDYLDYNRSAEEIKEDRAANAKRQRDLRERRRKARSEIDNSLEDADSNGERNALHNPLRNGGSHGTPALPLTSNPKSKTSIPGFVPRPPADPDPGNQTGNDAYASGKIDHLHRLAGGTPAALDKLKRATKNTTEADLVAAAEAAQGPNVRDRLAVILHTLKERKAARAKPADPLATAATEARNQAAAGAPWADLEATLKQRHAALPPEKLENVLDAAGTAYAEQAKEAAKAKEDGS